MPATLDNPSEAAMLEELKALLQAKLKAIEESESLSALEALIALGEAKSARNRPSI